MLKRRKSVLRRSPTIEEFVNPDKEHENYCMFKRPGYQA